LSSNGESTRWVVGEQISSSVGKQIEERKRGLANYFISDPTKLMLNIEVPLEFSNLKILVFSLSISTFLIVQTEPTYTTY